MEKFQQHKDMLVGRYTMRHSTFSWQPINLEPGKVLIKLETFTIIFPINSITIQRCYTIAFSRNLK